MSDRAKPPSPSAEPEGVGAGTGAAARDAGEEGTPAGTLGGTGAISDTDEEWTAVAGGTPTHEGAAAGALRDEGTEDGSS